MTRIIIESNNKKDVLLIKELAERLKIKYEVQDLIKTEKSESDVINYYKLIDKGVDVSNYGDPSLWQKNVREDSRALRNA